MAKAAADSIVFHVLLDCSEKASAFRTSTPFDREKLYRKSLEGVATVAIEPCAIGDVVVLVRRPGPGESIDTVPVAAIYERKAVSDFLASIEDGRNHFQTKGMLATGCRRVNFVILGRWPQEPLERKRFDTERIRLMERGVRMHYGQGENDMVQLLQIGLPAIADDMTGGLLHGVNRDMPLFRVAMEAGARPKIVTQELCWLEQLGVPEGMGRRTARSIAGKIKSFGALYRLYQGTVENYLFAALDQAPLVTKPAARRKKSRTHACSADDDAVAPADVSDKAPVDEQIKQLLRSVVGDKLGVVELGSRKKRLVNSTQSARMYDTHFTDDDLAEWKRAAGPINDWKRIEAAL